MMHTHSIVVRPPAVAGSFYPAEMDKLSGEVRSLLAQSVQAEPRLGWPKALIVPHAGYVYSGRVAAAAIQEWAPGYRQIRRVVLLGPTHRVAVPGLALSGADVFATPLGQVPVDRTAESQLRDLPFVVTSPRAHAWEHALEVQLPFLQHVLESFALVPVAGGDASPDQVATVLERLWGGPETVVLISSDLSHYHSLAEARVRDAATGGRILALDPRIDHDGACGATPVNGLLLMAKRLGLAVRRVAESTSADASGDTQRVVGYGAFALEEPDLVNGHAGQHLVALARQTIAHHLDLAPAPRPTAWWLEARGATFVTLKRHGDLRGCIGTLEARWPIRQDLMANAQHAAFDDPRFLPVDASEWPEVRVEVSVLSAPQPLTFTDEQDLLDQLQPEVDGLILERSGRRGTFLPQVWEDLPDKRQFLTHLIAKAGLPSATALTSCRFWRYRVAKFHEPEPVS